MVSLGSVFSTPEIYACLLIGGCVVLYYFDHMLRMKAQIKYEEAFMDRYQDIISRQQNHLPVDPRNRTPENLCGQYRSKWTPQYYFNRWNRTTYEPGIQTHYIGFRRLAPEFRPVQIEVFRCSKNYALVEAGDGISGYILVRAEPADENTNDTVFNIHGKFYYKLETPRTTEGIELATNRNEPFREDQAAGDRPSFPALV